MNMFASQTMGTSMKYILCLSMLIIKLSLIHGYDSQTNFNNQDFPPTANAGDDQTVQLPDDRIVLSGRRSTDVVGIVKYMWYQTGGLEADVRDLDSPDIELYNLEPGTYTMQINVTDALGQTDTDDVVITVLPEPDEPPIANAGPDQTVQLPTDTAILFGDRSTDDQGIVEYRWSVSSTTGRDPRMQDSKKAVLGLSNLEEGDYVLTLTVKDKLGQSSSDSARVWVSPAANRPPVADAGHNYTITLPENRVTLDGSRSTDDNRVVDYSWVITSGSTRGVRLSKNGSNLNVTGLKKGEYEFTLTVQDQNGLTDTDTARVVVKPACGLSKTDLVIIMDASTSVTAVNFQRMRDFVKEFLSNADINSGSVRVGINIFSTRVQIQFLLDDYTTEAEVMDAVNNIPYIYGSTNIADSLKVMREQMFSMAGDRPDAPNVAMILTDGVSNVNARRSIKEAVQARADGIHIYAIGIGLKDTREIDAIASVPASSNSFHVLTFDELRGLSQKIFNLCPDPTETPDLVQPIANAGDDQTVQLPDDRIVLSARRSTGDIDIVKYEWYQIGGPMADVRELDSPDIELYNLKPGTYTMQINVTDGLGQTDTDDVVITVLPESDEPPIANAGPDQTVQLPTDTTKLFGNMSTDDHGIVEYRWSVSSTTGRDPTMQDSNKALLDLSNLEEGDYVLTLTVKDKLGQSSSDSARIWVSPATNRPPVADAGRDYTLTLPENRVTLDGSRSTDDKGVVDYSWEITSGSTKGVRLSETGSNLNVTGLKKGEYEFTLKVRDQNGLTDTDTARIVVKPACGLSKTDLVIILDASTSVTEVNFQKTRDFVKEFLSNADINSGSVRVGIIYYSPRFKKSFIQFPLNHMYHGSISYTFEAEIIDAVDNIPYIYGSTNTADSLKVMRELMFTMAGGDRPDAPNVAMIITDGVSNMNTSKTIKEAVQARADGIHIYAIGIGLKDTREVDEIASVPASTNSFHVQTFDELRGLSHKIFNTVLCPDPTETPAVNRPLVADAGRDYTLTLPENRVTLDGNRSTDDKHVVDYSWEITSGSTRGVRLSETGSKLNVTGLKKGEYEFTLTIRDQNGFTDTDTAIVVVKPVREPEKKSEENDSD